MRFGRSGGVWATILMLRGLPLRGLLLGLRSRLNAGWRSRLPIMCLTCWMILAGLATLVLRRV